MTDIVERLQDIKYLAKTVDELNVLIAAMDEIERLRAVVQLGVEARTRQKAYFKTRDRGDLIASKQAEAAFDEAALGDKP